MEFMNHMLEHAAGQPWIYPVLLVFFFIDGFATILPSETAIVGLSALAMHRGEPNLWILGATALIGAMAGDNMAYLLGRKIGLNRWKWMRKPKVQKMFAWAHYELDKRGAVLIFTARYIPWGRVAVNYVAGQTGFRHKTFFWLDAIACFTWVGYSIGIGALAGRWVHNNPLLGVVIAVGFAVVLGVIVDHSLRWWHKHLEKKDTEKKDTEKKDAAKRDAEKKAASAEAAAAGGETAVNAAAGVERSNPAG